jgi:hypothetical protein
MTIEWEELFISRFMNMKKKIFADFAETSKTFSSRLYRSKTKTINSFEDFKKKYHNFYNDINN